VFARISRRRDLLVASRRCSSGAALCWPTRSSSQGTPRVSLCVSLCLSLTSLSLSLASLQAGWEALSSAALVERKWSKQPPIIIGPRGFQLIDNHHHCRSLFDSALPNSQKWMYFTVFRNWSDRSLDRYDFSMFSHTYLWPYDEKGLGPVDPSLFPRSLGDLLDDPFRSLAYLVRSRGGFDAVHLPFQEFRWANFFRDRLHSDLLAFQTVPAGDEAWCLARPYSTACLSLDAQRAALAALLPRALELASSEDAAHLPGFIQPGTAAATAQPDDAHALSNTGAAVEPDAGDDADALLDGDARRAVTPRQQPQPPPRAASTAATTTTDKDKLEGKLAQKEEVVVEEVVVEVVTPATLPGRSLVNNHTRRERPRMRAAASAAPMAAVGAWESSS